MDNKDLPLVMAEMLIEMQQLSTRVTRLETILFGPSESAASFCGEVKSLHQEIGSQHLEVMELVNHFTNSLAIGAL